MPQMSKIIRSRDEWKDKAVLRANEIREYRKSQKRYQEKISELKAQVVALEKTIEEKKTLDKPASTSIVTINEAQQTRILCILLTLQAVVSYRSVPRILNLFNSQTPLSLDWIPHFSSVINWTLRLGLGMLKQVKPISLDWVAIIDHSIDIGTKKALVVLRVSIEALLLCSKAITLFDCECIGVIVSEKVNGESVAKELEDILAPFKVVYSLCTQQLYGFLLAD